MIWWDTGSAAIAVNPRLLWDMPRLDGSRFNDNAWLGECAWTGMFDNTKLGVKKK